MLGERLLNSKTIEELKISNPEIRELFLSSLYQKPLFYSVRALILEFPLMNNNRMLLFSRAVKFSRSLCTVELFNMDLKVQSPTTSTNSATVLCLLYLNPKLKTVYTSGRNYERFSPLRLALVHKVLNERNREWPEYSITNLGKAFIVRQILAQLARRHSSSDLHFLTKDFKLLSTSQRRYISTKRICSSFKSDVNYTTFTLN